MQTERSIGRSPATLIFGLDMRILQMTRRLGEGFKGILYGGYMLTPDGVMLTLLTSQCYTEVDILENRSLLPACMPASSTPHLSSVPRSLCPIGR